MCGKLSKYTCKVCGARYLVSPFAHVDAAQVLLCRVQRDTQGDEVPEVRPLAVRASLDSAVLSATVRPQAPARRPPQRGVARRALRGVRVPRDAV